MSSFDDERSAMNSLDELRADSNRGSLFSPNDFGQAKFALDHTRKEDPYLLPSPHLGLQPGMLAVERHEVELSIMPYSLSHGYYVDAQKNGLQCPLSPVPGLFDARQQNINWAKWRDGLQNEFNEYYNSAVTNHMSTLDYGVLREGFSICPQIDKFICFGLGRIDAELQNDPVAEKNVMLRHVAIASIGRAYEMYFAQQEHILQGGIQMTIQVEKPYYDAYSDNNLANSVYTQPVLHPQQLPSLSFDAVGNPEGLLRIDGSTMVIILQPNASIRQVLGDLMQCGRIPAAILCLDPQMMGYYQQKSTQNAEPADYPAPRLYDMLRHRDYKWYTAPFNSGSSLGVGPNYHFYFLATRHMPYSDILTRVK